MSEAKVGPEHQTPKPKAKLKKTASVITKAHEEDDEDDEMFKEDEEEAEKDIIEAYRVAVKKFLATTTTGRLYDTALLLLSVTSSLEFIYQTYLDPVENAYLIDVMNIAEQVLAVVFSLDWLLNFFLAEHRILYISSFYSMIDILTVIPIWVSVYSFVPTYSQISNFRDAAVYFFVGMATTRILRALRIRKRLSIIEDEVQRCIGEIVLQLIVMILFFSALMQYLEAEVQPLEYHVYMYFMAVTITTVGYGDIAPDSTLGQMVVVLMIFTGVALIPQMTTRLVETMSRQSVYARASFHPKGKATTHAHVVICGDMGALALKEFFAELFHEDHENLNLHAVVLSQDSPTNEMGLLMRDPVYSMVITYLEGTALSQHDLKRASAWQAVSIFIMTNKFSRVPDEEDAKTILQQFSIKQHIAALSDARIRPIPLLCIQIVRPENRRHLIQGARDDDDEKKDLVMCLNELKMGIIAKAVMFPGTNTLIMNLLTSFADDDDGDESDDDGKSDNMVDNLNNDDADHWMYEYQRGCDWEIYTTELSDKFEGATFVKLSEMLYQRLGIVLFALQVEDLQKDKSNIRVLLNPADFIIPSKADFKIDAFVIAKNANQSDLTFSNDHVDAGVRDNDHMLRINPNQHGQVDEAKRMKEKMEAQRLLSLQSKKDGESVEKEKKPWQKLLRKFENSKGSIGSDQELMQKVEELYLRENYFTLHQRAHMEDNTIHISLEEEFPHIHNHTIIIGKSLSSIYDLIKNLRARYLEILRHIVILTPTEVPHHVWSRISIFRCILILRGSPLEEADILRAGIFKAQQVIVLADSSEKKTSSSNSNEAGSVALIDADAVFSYQCVKHMNESCSCVVEIVRSQNVGYLDPEGVVKSGGQVEYKFTPQFASGALFTTSLLDTLVCQAFYNPKIISVISELFTGVERRSKLELRANLKGDQQGLLKGVSAIVGSTLYQINMPELQSRTYGHLFKHLSLQGIIPLGLYRGVFSHMKIGPKHNKSCYCFCNPAKDTELFSCDKVFVLSPRPLILSSKKNIKLAEAAMTRRVLVSTSTAEMDTLDKVERLEIRMNDHITNMERSMQLNLDKILAAVSYRNEGHSVSNHSVSNHSVSNHESFQE